MLDPPPPSSSSCSFLFLVLLLLLLLLSLTSFSSSSLRSSSSIPRPLPPISTSQIQSFQERTRAALLETLHQDLHQRNMEFFGQPLLLEPKTNSESNGLLNTFRKAISGKVRSQSVDSQLATPTTPTGSTYKRNGFLLPISAALPPVGENEIATSPSTPVVTTGGHALQKKKFSSFFVFL